MVLADRTSLFKYVVKSVASGYGITPCFMAKPRHGLPGNSGHTHVSVVDKDGKILGRGHNMRVQKGSAILHVSMDIPKWVTDGKIIAFDYSSLM